VVCRLQVASPCGGEWNVSCTVLARTCLSEEPGCHYCYDPSTDSCLSPSIACLNGRRGLPLLKPCLIAWLTCHVPRCVVENNTLVVNQLMLVVYIRHIFLQDAKSSFRIVYKKIILNLSLYTFLNTHQIESNTACFHLDLNFLLHSHLKYCSLQMFLSCKVLNVNYFHILDFS